MTIAEAVERRDGYWHSCGYDIHEADDTFNDMNRDIIAAYREAFPEAMIGILLPDCELRNIPDDLPNFCAAFVVPKDDAQLRKDLLKYKILGVSLMFDTVYKRIKEIGGEFLSWS